MNKVATGDYDAIIVSQENFSSIPVSADTEYQFTIQQLTELEAGIEMAVRNGQRNDPSVKQMEKKKNSSRQGSRSSILCARMRAISRLKSLA